MSEIQPRVDVRSPKGPTQRHGEELLRWARQQLEIASEIVDNPGGGLLFATQAMGQVRVSLLDEAAEKYEPAAKLLQRAEDRAIRREFEGARSLLAEALASL